MVQVSFVVWAGRLPLSLADWWNTERKSIPKDGRTCFDSLIVLICWLLWKERNDRTFDRRVGTIQDVLTKVADELGVWYEAGFKQVERAVSAFGRSPGRAIHRV